ncbi:hypothetical protein GGF37_006202, partial [Kickxella alabastrina]
HSDSAAAELTEHCAREFAQVIRRIVPGVCRVTVSSADPHYEDDKQQTNDHPLARFCSDLCKGVKP